MLKSRSQLWLTRAGRHFSGLVLVVSFAVPGAMNGVTGAARPLASLGNAPLSFSDAVYTRLKLMGDYAPQRGTPDTFAGLQSLVEETINNQGQSTYVDPSTGNFWDEPTLLMQASGQSSWLGDDASVLDREAQIKSVIDDLGWRAIPPGYQEGNYGLTRTASADYPEPNQPWPCGNNGPTDGLIQEWQTLTSQALASTTEVSGDEVVALAQWLSGDSSANPGSASVSFTRQFQQWDLPPSKDPNTGALNPYAPIPGIPVDGAKVFIQMDQYSNSTPDGMLPISVTALSGTPGVKPTPSEWSGGGTDLGVLPAYSVPRTTVFDIPISLVVRANSPTHSVFAPALVFRMAGAEPPDGWLQNGQCYYGDTTSLTISAGAFSSAPADPLIFHENFPPLKWSTKIWLRVNTTGDFGDLEPGDGVCENAAGDCSLRAAIQEADALEAQSQRPLSITFKVPSPGLRPVSGQRQKSSSHPSRSLQQPAQTQVISISGPLPAVSPDVTIDGTTQTGYTAKPLIELAGDGSNNGLTLSQKDSVVALSIGGFEDGIDVTGNNTSISQSLIGRTPGGVGKANVAGISVLGAMGTSLISSTVSGNGSSGIYISAAQASSARRGSGWRGTAGPVNLTAKNVTVANNGGPGVSSAASSSFDFSTITGNQGAGFDSSAGTNTLSDSLLSSNAKANCVGTVADGGHNLDSGTSCGFSEVAPLLGLTNVGSDLAGVGPLEDNGGPVPTEALFEYSPAIGGAGTCSGADARGVARPQDAAFLYDSGPALCDIGAYQYEYSANPASAIRRAHSAPRHVAPFHLLRPFSGTDESSYFTLCTKAKPTNAASRARPSDLTEDAIAGFIGALCHNSYLLFSEKRAELTKKPHWWSSSRDPKTVLESEAKQAGALITQLFTAGRIELNPGAKLTPDDQSVDLTNVVAGLIGALCNERWEGSQQLSQQVQTILTLTGKKVSDADRKKVFTAQLNQLAALYEKRSGIKGIGTLTSESLILFNLFTSFGFPSSVDEQERSAILNDAVKGLLERTVFNGILSPAFLQAAQVGYDFAAPIGKYIAANLKSVADVTLKRSISAALTRVDETWETDVAAGAEPEVAAIIDLPSAYHGWSVTAFRQDGEAWVQVLGAPLGTIDLFLGRKPDEFLTKASNLS